MTLKSTWQLTRSDEFRGRVSVAVFEAGVDIKNSGENENSDRYKLAVEATSQNNLASESFIWPIACNASISASAEQGVEAVLDGDIQYVVATIWNEIATLRYPAISPSVITPPPGTAVVMPEQAVEIQWDPILEVTDEK